MLICNIFCRIYIYSSKSITNNIKIEKCEILEDNTEEIEEIPEERIENCTDRNYAYLATKYNELAKAVNKMKEGKE